MTQAKYLTGDRAGIESFIDRFDTFLFDCDGVLWSGEHTFPNTAETIHMLRQRGKQVVFVTNNSTKSRADYKKKFDGIGIACKEDEIFGSSYVAARYISRTLKLSPPRNKVFVLGESGVEQELDAEKIPYVGGTDPSYRADMTPEDYTSIGDGSALDDDVAVVLTALDRFPSYKKYSLGMAYLRRNNVIFLSTNIDSSLPSAETLFPGAGAISAPLASASGQTPLSFGKPSQAMMDAIEGKIHFERSKACMVGDRLNTDIQFGIDGGLGGTLCVLTGEARKEEFLHESAKIVPDAYIDKLSDLLK